MLDSSNHNHDGCSVLSGCTGTLYLTSTAFSNVSVLLYSGEWFLSIDMFCDSFVVDVNVSRKAFFEH